MALVNMEHLRRRIERELAELGMPDANWTCVKATSFGHQDRPAAIRDGILVVWQTDENTIAFYDESGRLLKTARLDRDDSRSKAA